MELGKIVVIVVNSLIENVRAKLFYIDVFTLIDS